jgi:hypothetical protein
MMDPDDRPFGSMRDHARSVRQSGYFVGHADVAQTVTEPVVEPLGSDRGSRHIVQTRNCGLSIGTR